MDEFLSRTEMLFDKQGISRLKSSSVAVFGAGGVGSYAIEALARCGIGRIGIVDSDVVCTSNINRQLYALHSTVGKLKVDVAEERIKDINPCAVVDKYPFFYDRESFERIDLSTYDYIVDAIDSMDSKVLLISQAKKLGVGIVSALSAGNKLDPASFEVADIYSTSVCPIAKILRKRLRDEQIPSLKVVYSKEPPAKRLKKEESDTGKSCVGSVSFVPSVMGLMLAGEVIKDIVERD